MTKQLHKLAWAVQDKLLRGPWPVQPEQRVLVDAWAALCAWHESGEHIYRMRDDARSPAIPPDLPLGDAPIQRNGQCYVIGRDQWIILARHQANVPIRVHAPDRVLGYAQPVLCYATDLRGGLASGYFNLLDQPTPSRLHLRPGTAISELWTRNLEAEEISEEGILLVKTIPLFYAVQK
ncbi:MAG TPA: hypothetical protein VNO50_10805 [Pyrinomonadaceae bacterium]|nr:hypothetical protein [Pyrinomonadaceae bacterium]